MYFVETILKKFYRKIKRIYLKKKRGLSKDNLCVVPWMHLAFEPSGKIVPCCLTSHHNYFAGDLNKNSIEEIWNSKNMRKLRLDMLAGVEPDICATCFDRERVTGESGRVFHNKEFKKVINIIPQITQPDGTCTEFKLRYWDFRFSNLCNFKCRSCGPRYSSAWVPDHKKLGWDGAEQDKVWNIESVNDLTNYDFLKDQVQYVEKIYFAGGEPLLMPEHWQTLELLVEHKKFDVKISYNTNASTLAYGGKSVLDYWKLWEQDKIDVWPSIDEIGERAELLRSGTVWPKIEENLKLINSLDNISVRPGITVGAWNVRRLPTIINYLVDLGIIKARHKHRNFFINLLEHPTYYHVHVLPEEYRKETIAELKQFIAEFNKKHRTTIDHMFTHILHELTLPWDKHAAMKFVWNVDQVDTVRDEDLYKIIPEMEVIRDMVRPEYERYKAKHGVKK